MSRSSGPPNKILSTSKNVISPDSYLRVRVNMSAS